MHRRIGLLLCVAMSAAGCYHATISTGATPSAETIEVPWATSFVYGLVPPATVETAARCRNGVAIVETQQSFVNSLVHILTFGIYTPMTIKVTCAAKKVAALSGDRPDMVVASDATNEEILEAFMVAAEQAVRAGTPVLVQFPM